MDLALRGDVNLAILQQFDQSITSSGNVILTAAVRGAPGRPRVTGQLELRNSSFDYVNLPHRSLEDQRRGPSQWR